MMEGMKDYRAVPVLMVDDEPKVLEGHRRSLQSSFDVHTAEGGRAALEAMENGPSFAVVVSDYKMPDMDGITLLSRIQERHPETVRMILTGYADMDVAIRAVNSGDIFRFLTKPCSPDDLIMVITAGIEHAEMAKAAHEFEIMRRLKNGFEKTLRAFTKLVEFRDPYTAGHMERTADISVMIAEILGLPRDDIMGLRLAAMVHDIGKVAVPAGILNKPGELTASEFSILKAHSVVGAEIFEGLGMEWPISRMIREHHERMDGSGYPDGVHGDQLLKQSKILAVADVIDALITNRPYRPSLGVPEVMACLRRSAGVEMDPLVVDVAIALLESGRIRQPGL